MSKAWYNVFDAGTLNFICQITSDRDNPDCYDPRIGGNGEVIWQQASASQYDYCPHCFSEDRACFVRTRVTVCLTCGLIEEPEKAVA